MRDAWFVALRRFPFIVYPAFSYDSTSVELSPEATSSTKRSCFGVSRLFSFASFGLSLLLIAR